MRFTIASIFLVASLAASGCARSVEVGTDLDFGSGDIPDTVQVSRGELTAGFATGRLRWKVDMPSFRMTKRPITRAEYEKCVASGACPQFGGIDAYCAPAARAEVARYGLDDDEAPATCVPPASAAAYCAWVGGALPSLMDWLYATRGPTPRRYAWGREKATCEHHVRAEQAISEEAAAHGRRVGMPVPTKPCGDKPEQRTLRVGEHKAAASPFGVEDVLLTPGELIRADDSNRFPPCREAMGGCVVTGLEVGAIDYAVALPKAAGVMDAPAPEAMSSKVYAFRCVTREN